MVQEEKLSEILSDFARTLVTDFPIQRILDHLVERIVGVLPITGAGVTLISPGNAPRYVAASDDAALVFEQLQTEVGEGPCLMAYESGDAVAVPDLSAEDRFPLFTPGALEAGLVAVFTFPLNHGDARLGALDLYRSSAGGLDEHDMGVAQTLADVAAAYLTNAKARDDAKVTTAQFHHRALHDPLTGLPNRLALQERLEHAAQRARRSHTNAAIIFADLDRFKLVNDVYGHQVGDELLVAVARRLSSLLRPGDTLVRLGGDEFVFLCEDLQRPADVEVLTRRISAAFADPFWLAGVEIAIGASIGVAFAGPGEDVSDELMVKADLAMYRAKRTSDGSRVIDLRKVLETGGHESFEHDLRAAFRQRRLDVAYQPIVRSDDGTITGVEALLRWTDRERGAVPAASMVGAAEGSELIIDIGAWVLERACRDRARWLVDHPATPLDLAVNVSARQLMTPGLVASVETILDATGTDPTAMILEMTETTFVVDAERAMTVLDDLSELGVRLALDDFGTGYSSLSYLRRFPVDIVKIDGGFIADLEHAAAGGALVAAVTDLAHVLGLTVTAEGVETAGQREVVAAIGCESAQGFYFAKPMPATAISAQLARSATPRLPAREPVAAGA